MPYFPTRHTKQAHLLWPILGLLMAFSCLFSSPSPALARNLANGHPVKRYNIAKAYYHNLQSSSSLSASRSNWLYCVNSFKKTYQIAPQKNRAPASLLTMGHIYLKMYNKFGNINDLDNSLASYSKVYRLFPKHPFADDALYMRGKILALEKRDYKNASLIFAKLLAVYPSGDMIPKAAADLKKIRAGFTKSSLPLPTIPAPKKAKVVEVWQPHTPRHTTILAKVTKIRHWSTKSYTRVVIETSQPVKFKDNLLSQNGSTPRRLYLNLFKSRINPGMPSAIPIDDGLLMQVRSGQFSSETVRVVLDTKSLSDYNIFSLNNPFRIVIDIKGLEKKEAEPFSPQIVVPNTPSLAQQLGLCINRIIIDPGHGGKDPGAIGINGLREKDIVLKVAKMVAQQIKKEIGCAITLTRNRDVFVRLEERTAIANTKGGDLFISIHANSAPNRKAHGVETYYLAMASTKEEMRVAALENSTSTNKISDLKDILKIMRSSKVEESARLATIIQKNMIVGLGKKYDKIGNHGIKKAPFVVLIGAQMPAILAEIAFMSNKTDAKRLKSDTYLRDVAEQITRGIIEYAQKLNMASL